MLKKIIEELFWRYCDADLSAEGIPEDEVDIIFRTVDDNDEFVNLLKLIALQDKDRYFKAIDDKRRERIKGEYKRTLYLIRKIRPPKKKVKIGGRFAK